MIALPSTIDRQFWKKFFGLALPVSLQSMMFAALGMFDVLMVSTLGEAQVASVGLGSKIFFFNLVVTFGLCSGINILGAQYVGAKEVGGVRKILIQTLSWAFLVNIGFAIFYIFNPAFFIKLASNDEQLIGLGALYLQITGWTILTTVIVVPFENAMRVAGHAKAPTIIGFLAIVINVFFNLILIFGFGPIEPMGVAGAAWATVIGRISQTVILLVYIKIKHPELIFNFEEFKNSTAIKPMIEFFTFVMPMLIQHMGWALGIVVYSLIIANMGVEPLAVHSLLGPIEGMVISGFFGFSTACGIMLGHELGANNFNKAWQQSWVAVYFGVAVALAIGLIVVFCKPLISEFLTEKQFSNPTLMLNVITVMALGMALKVHNMIAINGVLKSGGDVKYSAFIDLFGLWMVGIPLVALGALVWQLPLYWVLVLMLGEEIVKALMTVYRMVQRHWLNNLVEKTKTVNA